MRLLADENIPAPLIRILRERGFDLLYVAEFQPGLTDSEVLALASRESRPILTEDRDFGELIFRQKRSVPGVVMLGLPVAERSHWPRVIRLLQQHEIKIHGSYAVIDAKRMRMRPLPDPNDV